MSSVKDFTPGQRVATEQGNGEVTKIGRKYVYVKMDDAIKETQLLPEMLSEVIEPVAAIQGEPLIPVTEDEIGTRINAPHDPALFAPLSNAAPVGGRPPMQLKGTRASANSRRAARRAQRKSRRANRAR